ncbi:MAG: tetratricopeptide repeat-containing S1 family peptidase, partial [Pseudonocardiaceae bacterium]
MRIPERLVEVWAAGADGRGQCGSGWVVGQRGVLCCRHVLDRYLSSGGDNPTRPVGLGARPVLQIRQAAARSVSAWIDCGIAWAHPARDLVLLVITPAAGSLWSPPTERSPRLADMGQHPSPCVATGFPDAETKPTGLRDSDQAPGQLLPAGGARDAQGLVPFDVSASVPDDALLWEGFSGSAVHDEHARLVGLVAKAHPARQQRRLLVVPVEAVAHEPGFASAAASLGLDPVVEDHQAPVWRHGVDPHALTAAGIPSTVTNVEDLRAFGVKGLASDARGSHLNYLPRDKDTDLDAALAEARQGGRRIVLVVGDSAAGKTRSACEGTRKDPVLRGWRLVVPLPDGGLSWLANADLGWRDTVLWLDDLDKYIGRGLDPGTVRRVLGDAAHVVVVATMRTSQLQARHTELADPAWEFLVDETQVNRVDLDAALSDHELGTAHAQISDTALLSALDNGVGLGEWLVAGPKLMRKLGNSRGLHRVLADTIIAWYRTGLQQPLPLDDARRLWIEVLAPRERQRLLTRTPTDQEALFQEASAWVCAPIIDRDLYEQALVGKSTQGYIAHDYVVDHIVRDPQRPVVPDPIWRHALHIATVSPEAMWEIGITANQERAFDHAMTAMQTLARSGGAGALYNVGVLLGQLDRSEEAVEVYDQVVARFGADPEPALREQVAQALYNKGVTLGQLDRSEEEVEVYDQVVARFGADPEPALREQVAGALVNKGVTLGQLDRSEEAVEVYDQVVARFGADPEPALREQVAQALYNKG